ncbi:MAG: S41 family peptidase [Caulobacteraceae bacterium]
MSKLRSLAKIFSLIFIGIIAAILVLIVGLISVAHLVGPPNPGPAPKSAAERRARNLKVFDAAWREIDRHYYDRSFHGQDWPAVRREFRPKAAAAISDEDLYGNVLSNMTARLHDSHTSVVPRIAVASGAELGRDPIKGNCANQPKQIDLGFWPGRSWSANAVNVLADLRKGSPADRAGLQPGLDIAGWTVSNPPCGPARVDLDIPASGAAAEHHISYLVNQESPELSRASRTLPDGVQILRFNSFDFADARWLLSEFKTAPASGLILDLRHNSGGSDQILNIIAGALVGLGRPIGTWITADGRRVKLSRELNIWDRFLLQLHGTPSSFRYRGPLVVMIGPASASAAEVLAQSLHLNGRAVLVGERTSGQVEAAHRYWLPDGGFVEVTVADIEYPMGYRLENQGVAPDLFARQTLESIRCDRDLVVEAADHAISHVPSR